MDQESTLDRIPMGTQTYHILQLKVTIERLETQEEKQEATRSKWYMYGIPTIQKFIGTCH